jgi:hypothetical protein
MSISTEIRVLPSFDGVQRLYRFPNNYGASIVSHSYSLGGSSGLWELAVIKWKNDDFVLVYDTSITDSVIGYLNDESVQKRLKAISSLPRA